MGSDTPFDDPLYAALLVELDQVGNVIPDSKPLLRLVYYAIAAERASADPPFDRDPRRAHLVRCAVSQPCGLYCGVCDDKSGCTVSLPCCYTHIAKHLPISAWHEGCAALDAAFKEKVAFRTDQQRTPQDVLDYLDVHALYKSPDWCSTYSFLKATLQLTCDYIVAVTFSKSVRKVERRLSKLPKRQSDIVSDVVSAGIAFFEEGNKKKKRGERWYLHVGQVAAILVHVYCSVNNFKETVEMKTGEGKTNVCGIAASVIARRTNGFAFILTSSQDHAKNDLHSTAQFITSYLGREPVLISNLDKVLTSHNNDATLPISDSVSDPAGNETTTPGKPKADGDPPVPLPPGQVEGSEASQPASSAAMYATASLLLSSAVTKCYAAGSECLNEVVMAEAGTGDPKTGEDETAKNQESHQEAATEVHEVESDVDSESDDEEGMGVPLESRPSLLKKAAAIVGGAVAIGASVAALRYCRSKSVKAADAALLAESQELSYRFPLVAYGQITDVQKIVVGFLKDGKVDELKEWLSTCSFFLDESDHVLIEQAECLLFISSPCPSFQSMQFLLYRLMYKIDYVADYSLTEVKSNAISKKAHELSEMVGKEMQREERSKNLVHIIDTDNCIASWSGGALIARLKKINEDYVIELNSKDDPGIAKTCKITIVDIATGVESYGTRWTNEAPFVEALSGLPMGSSEPLAYFASLPYILQQSRWFSGISGTNGGLHNLNYYAKTYNIQSSFQIPRNRVNSVYHLPPLLSDTEEEWLRRLVTSVKLWLNKEAVSSSSVPSGPILIIAKNISKAQLITDALLKDGHVRMMKKDGSWICDRTGLPSAGRIAHLLPYYRGDHLLDWRECLPDDVIVVATNKGGRALDLKLDGACDDCGIAQHGLCRPAAQSSILYVILTEVLLGRQDEQARGRCGRQGKGGVVQYILLKDEGEADDPVYAYYKRKQHKDAIEENDLGYKSARVAQSCHNCWVLDAFCGWAATYSEEWIKKLASDKKTPPSEDHAAILKAVRLWFDHYLLELWALWLGYGGSRRGECDALNHFKSRMGLCSVQRLKEHHSVTKEEELLRRIYEWVTLLRVSSDALYSLGKFIVSVGSATARDICISIFNTVSDPKFKGVPTLPVGDGNFWRPEHYGNSAILLAFLSRDVTYLNRAEKQVNVLLQLFESDKSLKKQRFIEPVCCPTGLFNKEPVRSEMNYYVAQRSEIVRQLKFRQNSLKNASYGGNLTLGRFSEAMKDSTVEFQAYSLGLEWCKVVFEFYVGDSPFDKPSLEGQEMIAHFKKKASDLQGPGVPATVQGSQGGGGNGNTQLRNEEAQACTQMEKEFINGLYNMLDEKGKASVAPVSHRLGQLMPSVDGAVEHGNKLLRKCLGLLEAATEGSRPRFTYEKSFSNTSSAGTEVGTGLSAQIHHVVQSRAKSQQHLTGELCDGYLRMSKLCDAISQAGLPEQRSDLFQDQVDVRTDGTTAASVSRSEANAKAKEAFENSPFLRDSTLSNEELYLSNEALSKLREMAMDEQLGTYSTQFLQAVHTIRHYNECVMAGLQVDAELAELIHREMKELKRRALALALDHGDKVPDLNTPLENYHIAKGTLKEKVKEFATQAVIKCRQWWVRGREAIKKALLAPTPLVVLLAPWLFLMVKYQDCTLLASFPLYVTLWMVVGCGVAFLINVFTVVLIISAIFFAWPYVKYYLNGKGDMKAAAWGSFDFDILDVLSHPRECMTPLLETMRGALKQIWLSNIIQWWMNPSLALGLDVDERAHVQRDQARAHEKHVQQHGKWWTCGFILLALVAVASAVFTGGGSIFAFISLTPLMFQYASYSIENSNRVTRKMKDKLLTYLTTLQVIFSVLCLLATSFTLAAPALGSSQLSFNAMINSPYAVLNQVRSVAKAAWSSVTELMKLIHWSAVNLHQLKTVMSDSIHLLDKISTLLTSNVLRFGNSFEDLFNILCGLLLTTVSTWKLLSKRKLSHQQQQKQQQEEQQQQEREEIVGQEDTSTVNSFDIFLEFNERQTYLLDGVAAIREEAVIIGCTKSPESWAICESAGSITYTDSNGKTLVIGYASNPGHSPAWKVEVSRPLTVEEAKVFDLTLLSASPEHFILHLTKLGNGIKNTRSVKRQVQLNEVKDVLESESDVSLGSLGAVKVQALANGSLAVTIAPVGIHPTPKPCSFKIDQKSGEVTFCDGIYSPAHIALLLEALYPGKGPELVGMLHFSEDGAVIPKEWLANPDAQPTEMGTSTTARTLKSIQYICLLQSGASEAQMDAFLHSLAPAEPYVFLAAKLCAYTDCAHDKQLLCDAMNSIRSSLACSTQAPMTTAEKESYLSKAEKIGVGAATLAFVEDASRSSAVLPPGGLSAHATISQAMINSGASVTYKDLTVPVRKGPQFSRGTVEMMERMRDCIDQQGTSLQFDAISSNDEISDYLQDIIRRGDRRAMEKFIAALQFNADVPQAVQGTPVEAAYREELEKQKAKLLQKAAALLEWGFFGDCSESCVESAATALVQEFCGSLINTKMIWSNAQLTREIHAVNEDQLRRIMRYKEERSDGQINALRYGLLQEVLLCVTFNNEAIQQGSPYRLKVNTNTTATGGVDILMIDIRTGKIVEGLESKRAKSASHLIGNLKKYASPGSSVSYPEGTRIVTKHTDPLQHVYPQFQFIAYVPLPDGDGSGSIHLARADELFGKVEAMKVGQTFTIRAPRGVSGAMALVITKHGPGNYTVTSIIAD